MVSTKSTDTDTYTDTNTTTTSENSADAIHLKSSHINVFRERLSEMKKRYRKIELINTDSAQKEADSLCRLIILYELIIWYDKNPKNIGGLLNRCRDSRISRDLRIYYNAYGDYDMKWK